MNSYHRLKYLKLMSEASMRIETIRDFSSGACITTYNVTTIESAALQFRKLLELIAYASLVSNRKAYEAARRDISKDWHAERILKKIEALNPYFYPTPLEEGRPKRGGFLTRKQFAKLYDECSRVLHSRNPFSRTAHTHLAFERHISDHLRRIENLLKHHRIVLSSQEILVVTVPMGTEGPCIAEYYSRRTVA